MKLMAVHQEKQVLELLTLCFQENANFKFLFGSKKRIHKQLHYFLQRFIDAGKEKNAVFLSDDEQGVAIIFPVKYLEKWKPIITWRDALNLFSFYRLPKIWNFQRKTKAFLPKEDHLCFQFLGVGNHRNGIRTAADLKDACFDLSEAMHLPIYAQTSNVRTKILYERYGFKCYGELKFPNSSSFMYFLKRDCHEANSL